MKKKVVEAIVVFLLILTVRTQGSVLHVPSEYATIQAGINAAITGDTVLVAAGTYSGAGNYNVQFSGKSVTVISENGYESCIIAPNHQNVAFYISNTGSNTPTIDGFTIDGAGSTSSLAGAIYGWFASAIIRNCLIKNCTAMTTNHPCIYGTQFSCSIDSCIIRHNQLSGISLEEGSSIINTTIDGNSGLGIYFYGYNSKTSRRTITVSGCTISGNGDVGLGLAYIDAHISDCIITDNTSSLSGAGVDIEDASGYIQNSTIAYNTSTENGGGIYFNLSYSSSFVIDGCTIDSNTALNGGGIYCNFSIMTITNSSVINNSATLNGGGMYFNDSGDCYIGGSPQSAVVFSGNQAVTGMDLYFRPWYGLQTIYAQYNQFEGYPWSGYYVTPQEVFDLTGSTSENAPIMQDVFIAPNGDNSNDGLSPETPFKTIRYALSRVYGSQEHPVTINLAAGTYSPSLTNEFLPITIIPNVQIRGENQESTVLNAEGETTCLYGYYAGNGAVMDITVTGAVSETGESLSAILCEGESGPTISHVSLIGNTASSDGYVVSLCEGAVLDSSRIFNNNASAILCYNCALISNNTIASNTSTTSAIVKISSLSNTRVVNNLIHHNVAAQKSALYCDYHTNAAIENCTVVSNTCTSTGGGLTFENSSPAVYQSIIWDNVPSQITTSGISQPYVSYCDIQGGYPGDAVLNLNPLFVEGFSGAYYLSQLSAGQTENSPCIDAGNTLSSSFCFEIDETQWCLNQTTTNTADILDDGITDLGFHFMRSLLTPTSTPVPTVTYTPEPPTITPTSIPPTYTPTATSTPFYPTYTPSPTKTPTIIPATPTEPASTPTPHCQLGVTLSMPSDFFAPGDTCWLIAELCNPGPDALPPCQFYLAMDLEIGIHWFYPSWSQYPPELDYVPFAELLPGTYEEIIFSPFEWPSGAGSYERIHFYGALVDEADFTLIGKLGSWTFGYGE